jgi:4-amino-4-deoxy-L-arabinose transferase-like glycosyltransferase
MSTDDSRSRLVPLTALVMMAVLAGELWFSIRHLSQTFDESAHMYSGMGYWKHGNYGVNPEHPPLVKLLAALPLLSLHPAVPDPPLMFFRGASGAGGVRFLYSNDAERMLFRSRVAASLITLLLAWVIFAMASEMFGAGAGLLALLIFVFEPNFLANGALVATDVAAACGMLAAIWMFYRYAKQRTLLRLLICGVVTGLALAAKHSTLILFVLLLLLAGTELIRRQGAPASLMRETGRWIGSLAAIAVIAVAVLWSFYGFHYRARPAIIPPLAVYVKSLHHPWREHLTLALSHSHLLPEAYVYGLSDIEVISSQGRPTYLLGHLYPTGHWFYFPTTFLVKSTLGFLALLGLSLFAGNLWAREKRRELLFLAVPALTYFGCSVLSHLDLGLRHILPVYVFLIVLAGAGAWGWMQRSRAWKWAVIALLTFHAVSSLHAYPFYLSYSNEAWGGPRNTYKYLSDANVGWTSGLKALHGYIEKNHITNCWFAFSGVTPLSYYQIPCRPLPTYFSGLLGAERGTIPAEIDGTVFVHEVEHAGFWWGPGDLNPYREFAERAPDDLIANEILVFHGRFDVTPIAALSHLHTAAMLERQGKMQEALAEMQTAVAMNPNSADAHASLADLLFQLQRNDEARAEVQKGIALAKADHPEFQTNELEYLESLDK